MMKIHTTQNLNSLEINRQLSTDTKEIKKKYFKNSNPSSNISFQGWDIVGENSLKKAAGKLRKKILSSKALSKVMYFIQDYEVQAGAIVAFIVGITLRIPTILGYNKLVDKIRHILGLKEKSPEEKARDRQNDIYAAAHSGASITMGLITAMVVTMPMIWGKNAAKSKFSSKRPWNIMKKIAPQIKEEGNLKKGIDASGNKISLEYTTPMQTFEPVLLKNASEETKQSIFGTTDLDKILKMIKEDKEHLGYLRLHDTSVENEYVYTRLDMLDKNILNELGGKNSISLENIMISSPIERTNTVVLTDGTTREVTKGGKTLIKPNLFQNNGELIGGVDNIRKKGTKITEDMIKASKTLENLDSFIGWLPDVVTKVPIGLLTVGLYPPILKLLNVEKADTPKVVSDKTELKDAKNNTETLAIAKNSEKNVENTNNNVNFKAGKKGNQKFLEKLKNKIGNIFSKIYAERAYNSEGFLNFIENLGEKLKKVTVTQLMTVLGSVAMTSSYIYGTLTNKKLDKDRKKTLAINQALCCILPTALGLWINNKLDNYFKNIGKEYSGRQEGRLMAEKAAGKLTDAELKTERAYIDSSKRGWKVIGSLTVFTLIYRYLAPVLVTPIANKISDILNKNRKNKEMELSINTNYNKLDEQSQNTTSKAA